MRVVAQARQLALFQDTQILFQGRPIKSVTFKGKFDYPIHRWFRLTPSFSPELVADVLDHWQLPQRARILEPFCGVGTVPVVCQEKGLLSCSVELNPLLHFVSRVKTTPVENPLDLLAASAQALQMAGDHLAVIKSLKAEVFLIEYHASIPNIRNVNRWWSLPVLKKLVALKMSLDKTSSPPEIVDLMRLAVAGILVQVSNARHDHPSLSFAETPRKDAPVFEWFRQQIEMMAADLERFPSPRLKADVFRGNSKHLEETLPAGSLFDAVITSPPYPNRYSYARETRPHMFFLGLVQNGREVGQLETEAIGGTWGRATSILDDYFEYRSTTVRRALHGIPDQIGHHSRLMKNYVIKYFNNFEEHVESLYPFVRSDAKLAYVIGNSRFYDAALPTDEILADIFEAHGFGIVSIERMRRRNSKSGLYEAIVFMEKLA